MEAGENGKMRNKAHLIENIARGFEMRSNAKRSHFGIVIETILSTPEACCTGASFSGEAINQPQLSVE